MHKPVSLNKQKQKKCRVDGTYTHSLSPSPNNNVHTGLELERSCIISLSEISVNCLYCFLRHNMRRFFMFLLLLISEHEMRRLMLMVNDANLFTGIRHQHQPIILTKGISINCLSGNSERIFGRYLAGKREQCGHSDRMTVK